MPRAAASTAAAPTAWTGAPPVTENGFSFANGEFFADSSSQNRHRRATPGELKSHFDKGTDKDHPAHWFEAQLIHYGLQASKTKSVARMRLFDAVKANTLAVPSAVSKLEAKLKKEWNKSDRDAKKALRDAAALQAKPKATAATKRKADDSAASTKAASKPAAKKTKTATETTTKTIIKTTIKTTTKTTAKTAVKATTKTAIKTPAKSKEPSASASASKKKATAKTPTKTPAKKDAAPTRKIQTARRGGISQGPSRSATAASSSSATPIRPGMARRSGAIAARGRIQAPSGVVHLYDDEEDDEGEPYGGYSDEGGYYSDDAGEDYHRGEYSEDSPPPPYSEYSDGDSYSGGTALAPLGLINGDYSLSSPYVTREWPQYGSSFNLVLTLSGSTLWARFDLGIVEGIMYFENRPMQSSNDPVSFIWRGREIDGPIMYHNNHGHITFLGDGRIEGELDYMSISFRGRRVPGQGTRSSASISSLQSGWNGYSEEEYERERVSRW